MESCLVVSETTGLVFQRLKNRFALLWCKFRQTLEMDLDPVLK
jgi:hypothetical protein